MEKQKQILLCVAGGTPAIITETLFIKIHIRGIETEMRRFALIENIDFKLKKLDKWLCSTKEREGVRQNGLISLSKRRFYLRDGANEGRDESGLKLSFPLCATKFNE